jgi:hypothetical protein
MTPISSNHRQNCNETGELEDLAAQCRETESLGEGATLIARNS